MSPCLVLVLCDVWSDGMFAVVVVGVFCGEYGGNSDDGVF